MKLDRSIFTAASAMILLGSTAFAQESGAAATASVAAVEPVPEIAQQLPAEIRDRGEIRIGATSTNMPAQFTTESGALTGVVIDLYNAAAQVLDIEPKIDVVTFDALQPGVDSGRYDVVTMGDSVEREKLVDIISLYSNGAGIIAHASNAAPIDYKQDLCGHSVAVTKGTLLSRIVAQVSEENCVAQDKEPIEVSTYVDNAGVALAVSSQQDDFGLQELVVAAAYAARTPNVIQIVGQDTFSSSGAAIKKGNDELRDAFHAALLHLVKVGVYDQVLAKYGIGEMALPELPVNLAGQAQG